MLEALHTPHVVTCSLRTGSPAASCICPLRAGMLSGKLLQDFCPDTAPCDAQERAPPAGGTGTCDGRALWGIIGAITLTSPLLILALQACPPCPRRSALPLTCTCTPCEKKSCACTLSSGTRLWCGCQCSVSAGMAVRPATSPNQLPSCVAAVGAARSPANAAAARRRRPARPGRRPGRRRGGRRPRRAAAAAERAGRAQHAAGRARA